MPVAVCSCRFRSPESEWRKDRLLLLAVGVLQEAASGETLWRLAPSVSFSHMGTEPQSGTAPVCSFLRTGDRKSSLWLSCVILMASSHTATGSDCCCCCTCLSVVNSELEVLQHASFTEAEVDWLGIMLSFSFYDYRSQELMKSAEVSVVFGQQRNFQSTSGLASCSE